MNQYDPTGHISLLAHDVLEYLKASCVGKENAAKIKALAWQFDVQRREIEQATEELRGAGLPLCSLVCPPYGLFLARDFAEMEGWVRQITHRMEKMAIHRALAVRQLRAQAEREGLQLSMELVTNDQSLTQSPVARSLAGS